MGRRRWAGLTTNGVAEAAGVSIGSLHQYFPNKLALVEAVRRRNFEDVLAALRASDDASKPAAQRIEAVVEGKIGLHSRNPAAHHTLLEETPRSRESKAAHDESETEYMRRYEALISVSPRARRFGSRSIAAQVVHGSHRGSGSRCRAQRHTSLTSPEAGTGPLDHRLARFEDD